MPDRHVPVKPNLRQLRRQAKDLLRQIKRGDQSALEDLARFRPDVTSAAEASLSDAQFVLARTYGIASWPRLVQACQMTDAICRDNVEAVRDLIRTNPALLDEDARGVKGNWGPPMSYAANLGRDRIITMLRELGANDLDFAFGRACLQGEIRTARLLHSLGARPAPGILMWPCETLNPEGLALMLELGAAFTDERGDRLAPLGLILQTYGRNPAGKHGCLDIAAAQGIEFPDTPPMAVHRGRIDRLERHLDRDPALFSRTFTHEEIYPPALGCDTDHSQALHGTPLGGATLLHMCVDFDEGEILRWMLARGADPNAAAAVDGDNFGGHTPLFSCVVTQPLRLRESDEFARLLLDRGANPNARASLRKELRGVSDESLHEYRDVTPLGWGEQFHDQDFVSRPAMKLIAKRGGRS